VWNDLYNETDNMSLLLRASNSSLDGIVSSQGIRYRRVHAGDHRWRLCRSRAPSWLRAVNSPWGITRASFAFRDFSGKILIGNFGDARWD